MTDPIWAIATVASGRECKFRDRLAGLDIGASAYIPFRRYLVKPRHVRKPKEVSRPAFPRYVFVSLPDLVQTPPRLAQTHIDHRFMRLADGGIAIIRPQEVFRIKEMEASGLFDNLPIDVQLVFREGSILIVKDGVFEGEKAQVLKTPSKKAKRVLVDILGNRVELPLASFGRV